MTPERKKVVGQYVVFRLKLIETIHLILLSLDLKDRKTYPSNELGHESKHFCESLLGVTITSFLTMCDDPKSTNARAIWRELHPAEAHEIGEFWKSKIKPGVIAMKGYRNSAGAHADKPSKYFAAKVAVLREQKVIVEAIDAFLLLATCLLRHEAERNPSLDAEIEQILLDIELTEPSLKDSSFNRKWLKDMKLIGGGSYRKVFP
jgi:hypothetical protein